MRRKQVNKFIVLIMIINVMVFGAGSMVLAAEHGGQEHGGTSVKENGSTSTPSNDAIRTAMTDYVMEESKATGTFDVLDPETGQTRQLELVRVHERVGKTGNYYYSCADFKDIKTGQLLDLDLDVEDEGGRLSVKDVRIHKVDGHERYTYDSSDNRIPVIEEGSHSEGSEHGGKEHGGN